jgi:two-component system response regulator EvgA
MIRVLLAVPYHKLVSAIETLLEEQSDINVIMQTDTEATTVAAAESLQPDIVVLDIDGYVFSGFEVLVKLVQSQPHIPVLVLGEHDLPYYAERMLRTGAAGYLSRTELVDRLPETVRTIAVKQTEKALA